MINKKIYVIIKLYWLKNICMLFFFNVENYCDNKKVKFFVRKVFLCRFFVINYDGCI